MSKRRKRLSPRRHADAFVSGTTSPSRIFNPCGRPARPVLTADQAAGLIPQLVHFLAPFVDNRWENEAEARHRLRLKFIEEGNPFEPSDHQAAKLVNRAFDELGRGLGNRPSFAEGQRSYTIPRECCKWCSRPLDPNDPEQNAYCSPHCRSMVKLVREERGQVILRERPLEPIPCACCGKFFRPKTFGQIFCSHSCYWSNKKVLEDRPCEWCGKSFSPRLSVTRFCSHACAREWGAQATPPRPCQHCGQVFSPKWAKAIYCSDRCSKDAVNGRLRERTLAKRAAGPPRRCACCGKPLALDSPNEVYCGRKCALAERAKRTRERNAARRAGATLPPGLHLATAD